MSGSLEVVNPGPILGTTIDALNITNVQKGDLILTFNPDKPEETKRGKELVEFLLTQGYSIFVKNEAKQLVRIKTFKKKTGRYIVTGEHNTKIELNMENVDATAITASAGG